MPDVVLVALLLVLVVFIVPLDLPVGAPDGRVQSRKRSGAGPTEAGAAIENLGVRKRK